MVPSFDIPEDLFKRAEAAARAKGVTPRQFILDALLEAVEDHEDVLAADAALERIRQGEDQIIESEEFWRGLEVEDKLSEAGAKIRRKA